MNTALFIQRTGFGSQIRNPSIVIFAGLVQSM